MPYAATFSPDYQTARSRFCRAAERVGAHVETHPITPRGPDGEELAIDVATLGPAQCGTAIVASSGLHGVEGFFGSAVQLAWLERRLASPRAQAATRYVLLHALNPFGLAWQRRCNEENVDLNRSFLLPGEKFTGAPPLYRELDPLLNPPSPPAAMDLFGLRMLLVLVRHGRKALQHAIPVGQYDFPKGLFFGGRGPSQTQRLVEEHMPRWLGDARDVLHIDFHTGLGRRAKYKLLLGGSDDLPHLRGFRESFEADVVCRLPSRHQAASGPVAYVARGGWDRWCVATSGDRRYAFVTAEFGTYAMLRVLAALRAENRAHFWSPPDDPVRSRTRRRLSQVFAPAGKRWRETVVRSGLAILEAAENVSA